MLDDLLGLSTNSVCLLAPPRSGRHALAALLIRAGLNALCSVVLYLVYIDARRHARMREKKSRVHVRAETKKKKNMEKSFSST